MKLWYVSVIVDEATHITEAELVTCLPQSCQHLVLLGKCAVFEYLTFVETGIACASQYLTVSGELSPVQDAASCKEGHPVSADMLEPTPFRVDVGRQQLGNDEQKLYFVTV